MKTTLIIDDHLMRRLKQKALKEQRTLTEFVEMALRMMLETTQKPKNLPPLPSFKGGRALVDVANREALYQAMEEEECLS